ncbi:hypothetical protein KP509_18G044300 [Ceratopteris richardii]|nr:hypothetical protein KP509_18G044300 [Ceratopteris richardii]
MKSIAMRSAQTRNNRMENLCWRIWHLTRKKKQIEWEDAQRLARRHYEREQGHKAASKELSEFSDGEKPEPSPKLKTASATLSRNYSNFEMFVQQQQSQKKKSLYIVLISIHGLVRGYNMELGRDSDTGGQVKYVVELARALAMMTEVYRVDLLTRQICSPDVDWSYGEPTEMLTHGNTEGAGESSGAYIVRIPCGPRDKYVAKEHLWPYVQEFVDGALAHILNMSKALGEQVYGGEKPVWPHVIHGHYADAGNIACLLSGALNVPMVLTGHSLGRNKLEQLLKQGRDTKEDINNTYRIMRRIEGEELSLDGAEIVITSTRQEVDEQWGLYDGFDVRLERVFRARAKQGMSCYGRYMPRMVVIPPGMDFSSVISLNTEDGDSDGGALSEPMSPKPEPPIWAEIKRFFSNPHKPMILALARPDPKKNLTTLVKAFGESRSLRELANLVLIMGNRDDIDEMSGGNAAVLTTIIKLIDKYNLYGLVAYPKHHKQNEVPSIYRLVARTKGVFINPALVEPFGLTLIEAAAHGIPTVATKNGGPVDIHKTLKNGLLVDPHNQKEIADALLKLVSDRNMWMECRKNGLTNIFNYSWPQHCRIYLARIAQCRSQRKNWQDGSLLDRQPAIDEEYTRDSLKDVHTHLSIDERSVGNGSDFLEYHSKLQSVQENSNGSDIAGKGFWQRKMRKVFVIAIDSYTTDGKPHENMLKAIQNIVKHVKEDPSVHGPGFILSTAMRFSETIELLNSGGVDLFEFDALICGSGSEIYYPDVYADNASSGISKLQFCIDQDYLMHIDYRWGREGVRRTIARFLASGVEDMQHPLAIEEDGTSSNEHCLAYKVKDPSQVLRVEELRKNLRMRGLRCHVLYCKSASLLYIMPLFASRAQALRYLFVRWGTDISNMCVFVGEAGDNDYEELLCGALKTIIVKGYVEGNGSDKLLRGSGSYHREDMVPVDSPNIVTVDLSGISQALQQAMKQ